MGYNMDNTAEMGRRLAHDMVSHMHGTLSSRCSQHSATLARVVDELHGRHSILFASLAGRLQLDILNIDTARDKFLDVAAEVFEDGEVNWGRVATLYAFGCWLVRDCRQGRHGPLGYTSTDIMNWVAEYVESDLTNWIQQNGGWDEMLKVFKQPQSLEKKMWNSLLFTFVGLGVTTLFAVAAR